MEKDILGVTENHLKNNTVIGHSQKGLMKGNCCLSKLIYCYNKVSLPVSGCARKANRVNPSVLQHLINNLDPGLEGICRKFVDDTKLEDLLTPSKALRPFREILTNDFQIITHQLHEV